MEHNLTKKNQLKKFLIDENNYSLSELKKIQSAIAEIIKAIEEREEAIRLREEQKKAKYMKVMEHLHSEGVTVEELQTFMNSSKSKKKVKKQNTESRISSCAADVPVTQGDEAPEEDTELENRMIS